MLRFLRRFASLAAAFALTLALHAETFPFVLPWDDASAGVTNVADWLAKPAGGSGFVTARDGHLFAGEKRIRFFGVNVAFGGNFPTHADAEKVAARMAKFGINCVRFHHLDTVVAPEGLLKADKRTLDPDRLDRMDYFIAQLKKHGIYANLNLHVGLAYPGLPKWEGGPSYFKGVDNFFPAMIEQQRDYARALLTHVNPFTGNAYTAEPAVAFIEINNENGLMSEWHGGGLDTMTDPYAGELRKQWNEWLTAKYQTGAALIAEWNQGAEPVGEEVLVNGAFTDGFTRWVMEQHEGAKAFRQIADGKLTVQVTEAGKQGWHVQFNQSGLKLDGGRAYTIAFRARASTARTIDVNLGQAHEPWGVLATHKVALTPEWQDIRFTVTSEKGDGNARLSISNLAVATGEFGFEKISLKPGGIEAFKADEKLGSIEIFRKRDLSERTLPAQRDWNRFLYDTEARYWPAMRQFIREDLGAKSLVLGSATGFSPWPVQAMLDVVDAHSYWQHPHFPRRPWDSEDWTVQNIPMAGAANGGALETLAMRRVAGKPFIVTEYNGAAPNTYSSESFLELCALAGLQDWDGVFAFAYSHRLDGWGAGKITSFFDIDQHPTKMATLPAAVALFCRGDVRSPAKPHIAEVKLDRAIETIRTGSPWHHAGAYGVQAAEIFRHPVGVRLAAEDSDTPPPSAGEPVIQSDNGELTWDTRARRMSIQTPRSAGVVGTVHAGDALSLGNVKIVAGTTMQDWATINLTVMDGPDFQTARRVLVTATGYADNKGMRWKDAAMDSVGRNWGTSPSLVEGIAATVTLPAAALKKAWALDARGQRAGEVPVKIVDGRLSLEIGPKHQTLWYEIAGGE